MRKPIGFDREEHREPAKEHLRAKHLVFMATALLAGAFAAGGAQQAAALPIVRFAAPAPIVKVMCKYGTPHCVNPSPVNRPKIGGAKLPGNGWTDPDCKYYGNCNTGTSPQNWGDPSIARKGPSRSGRSGALHPVHVGSPKVK